MKRRLDHFPKLRRRTGLVPPDKYATRRDRVIYKVLLRARRRWDLYGDRVKSEELDGEASARTEEWRLIKQNGELLRSIRAMDFLPERKERLNASEQDRDVGPSESW